MPASVLMTSKSRLAAPGAPVQYLQLDGVGLPEVLPDLLLDLRFGRCGEAEDRGGPAPARVPVDELADVAVVGPEIVAPLGETVRLVQDPGPDETLFQRRAGGPGPQLLRRDQDDGGVAQPDPVQGLLPFRHGQQPVDGDDVGDSPVLKAGDLVGHEGHQWGDDHREGAGLLVT